MKIRSDFVSNSSSGNFIVVLDKPITEYTKDEFFKMFKTTDRKVTDMVYDMIKDEKSRYIYRGYSWDVTNNIGLDEPHCPLHTEVWWTEDPDENSK